MRRYMTSYAVALLPWFKEYLVTVTALHLLANRSTCYYESGKFFSIAFYQLLFFGPKCKFECGYELSWGNIPGSIVFYHNTKLAIL